MVLLAEVCGFTLGRTMEGIDLITPGDFLFMKDALGRERIGFLERIHSEPYSLHIFDIGSEKPYLFKGGVLTLGQSFAPRHGYSDVPSIKEWGILHESGIRSRGALRRNFAYFFIRGEMFSDMLRSMFSGKGGVDESTGVEFSEEDLYRNVFGRSDKYSLVKDLIPSEYHLMELLGPPSGFQEISARLAEEKWLVSERLVELRKRFPVCEFEKAYGPLIDRTDRTGFIIRSGCQEYWEHDLEKGPYKPLDEIMLPVPVH